MSVCRPDAGSEGDRGSARDQLCDVWERANPRRSYHLSPVDFRGMLLLLEIPVESVSAAAFGYLSGMNSVYDCTREKLSAVLEMAGRSTVRSFLSRWLELPDAQAAEFYRYTFDLSTNGLVRQGVSLNLIRGYYWHFYRSWEPAREFWSWYSGECAGSSADRRDFHPLVSRSTWLFLRPFSREFLTLEFVANAAFQECSAEDLQSRREIPSPPEDFRFPGVFWRFCLHYARSGTASSREEFTDTAVP